MEFYYSVRNGDANKLNALLNCNPQLANIVDDRGKVRKYTRYENNIAT